MTVSDDDLISALRLHGSNRKAATALGLNVRTVERRRAALALKGWSPEHDMTRRVPDGFKVKGTSTLYRDDGTIAAQWVKSSADRERQAEMLREAMSAMVDDLPKVAKRPATRADHAKSVMAAYVLGDPHFGMRAWGEETGADWDLAIAEQVTCGAVASLVEAQPATETALIVNLGDALHYDSMAPITPRSGHLLDADGRYAKMVHVAIKAIRQCIESALDKHKRVHVINAIGNHDETGAVWLSQALAIAYEREPRVTVDTSPSVFNYFRFGKTLLGIHHGHTAKADSLAGVMAADKARDWGETEWRYWWCGHIHHASRKEYPGVSVESFGTLASKDAYATAGGWRAREQATAILIHKDWGEVGRTTRQAAMFRKEAA